MGANQITEWAETDRGLEHGIARLSLLPIHWLRPNIVPVPPRMAKALGKVERVRTSIPPVTDPEAIAPPPNGYPS